MRTSPWIQESVNCKDPEERLSKEIQEFITYIQPTKKEAQLRNEALSQVTKIVKEEFPSSSIHAYGSIITGLELPCSDVDICVKIPREMSTDTIAFSLRQLRKAMLKKRLTTYARTNVVARPNMKVPVFALSLNDSDIEVDICINNDAPSTATTIKWLEEYSLLKPLFLVLKHGLSSLMLDNHPTFYMMDTKRNGMASFTLICLIVRFFQMEEDKGVKIEDLSLGNTLLRILKYWSEFDFVHTGIFLKNKGGFFKKDTKSTNSPLKNPEVIAVEDPDNEDVNVARSSTKIDKIISGLKKAYQLLDERLKTSEQDSLLSSFILLPANVGDQRPCGKQYVLEGLGNFHLSNSRPSRMAIRHALNKEDKRKGYSGKRGRYEDESGRRSRHEDDSGRRSRYEDRPGKKGNYDGHSNHNGKRKRQFQSDPAESSTSKNSKRYKHAVSRYNKNRP
ncbi:hypothetical protein K450DRAFT_233837 [Umbelopsis ramanniana AG]|uniref:polynucleotide adenylyltransferase n=1 Tax=Umbelopsis ramanniana AG TaxID=1314678 RepID=A0AAD5ED32_UMBRA|nr:uncharacterized protein K450DRAFT_233837 [Umbelopsis ramanniana AG]KAI8581244.1 hypothetical protein K450DRAFT_233837 [Umbelopsis ramanniana AG]